MNPFVLLTFLAGGIGAAYYFTREESASSGPVPLIAFPENVYWVRSAADIARADTAPFPQVLIVARGASTLAQNAVKTVALEFPKLPFVVMDKAFLSAAIPELQGLLDLMCGPGSAGGVQWMKDNEDKGIGGPTCWIDGTDPAALIREEAVKASAG